MSRNWNDEVKQAILWQFYFSIFAACTLGLAALFIFIGSELALIAMPMVGFGLIGIFVLGVLSPIAVAIALVKQKQFGTDVLKQALWSLLITYVIIGGFIARYK